MKKPKANRFLLNLFNRVAKHDIMTYAAALSFYLLQASIPLMMVLVSILSHFLEGREDLIINLLDFLPKTTNKLILEAIDILIASSQSPTVTTITILFALFSATSGVNKLINAINHAYGLKNNKQAVKQRIMSVFFTIIFISLLVFVLIFQVYNTSIIGIFNAQIVEKFTIHFNTNIQRALDMISSPLFMLISTAIPFLIMAIAVGFFYRYSPSNASNRISVKEAFCGGLFATVASFIASFIYSYFINNFSNQSLVYGALAGILALFIWLLMISTILILGAECIAAYREGYKEDYFDKNLNNKNSIKDKIISIIKRNNYEKWI